MLSLCLAAVLPPCVELPEPALASGMPFPPGRPGRSVRAVAILKRTTKRKRQAWCWWTGDG